MPIYEYRCRSCEHQLEVLQRLGDRPLRKCPECGGRLSKLISRTSFQLKGGGWFAQGYGVKPASGNGSRPKGKPRRARAGSGDATSSSSSSPSSSSSGASSDSPAGDKK